MRTWMADGLLLLAAIIYGSAFVPQAWAAKDIGAFQFTGLRFALGALVVAPLAWQEWRGRPARRELLNWQMLWPMLGLGLIVFLAVVMQQIGLIYTSVTNAGVLTALYVPLTPLLAWVILRHRPHWLLWPSAIACVIGTWLLAGAGSISVNIGDVWVLCSSLFWALHLLFVGPVSRRVGGIYLLCWVQFCVCAVASLSVSVIFERWSFQALSQQWANIAYTGLLSVGIGYTLQMVGQRYAQASHAAIILSSETLFAALFGAWLMGDRLTGSGLLGCGLIVGAIVLVQFKPRQKNIASIPPISSQLQ